MPDARVVIVPLTSRVAVGLATPMPTFAPEITIEPSRFCRVIFLVSVAELSTIANRSASAAAVSAVSSEILASAFVSSYDMR